MVFDMDSLRLSTIVVVRLLVLVYNSTFLSRNLCQNYLMFHHLLQRIEFDGLRHLWLSNLLSLHLHLLF